MASQPNLINQIAMQLDNDNVSFDPIAFDTQAQNKGSELDHYIQIPCPNANFDSGDVRSSHTGECCNGTGRQYFWKGIVQGIMTQVSKSQNFYPGGTIDHSSVYLIIPRFYKDTQTQIIAAPYDRLVPKCSNGNLWISYWEQVQISPTGTDFLSYPAEQVELLIDASGKKYTQDVDFSIVKGAIVWKSQNRPTTSLYQNAGQCYSIRYFIQAAYLVNQCIHDTRTIRTADPVSGELSNVRYPQYLMLTKEVNFLANNKNRQPGNLSDHFAAEQY